MFSLRPNIRKDDVFTIRFKAVIGFANNRMTYLIIVSHFQLTLEKFFVYLGDIGTYREVRRNEKSARQNHLLVE